MTTPRHGGARPEPASVDRRRRLGDPNPRPSAKAIAVVVFAGQLAYAVAYAVAYAATILVVTGVADAAANVRASRALRRRRWASYSAGHERTER